jgi:nucleoid-associated protein YejK
MESKIYATGNETLKGEFNISYYIFEKDKTFLDWLSKLLVEVFEIQNGEQKAKFIVKEKDRGIEEVYIKDINKMVDLHEKYSNKNDKIDIFYGNNKIYVTLRKSKEIRKKFTAFVRKTKDWIKAKSVNKIPIYAKKQKR